MVGPMGRREAVLHITFGPASTPVLPRAVSYARGHADSLEETEPGVWRATFRLSTDESRYGRALQLLFMTWGWKTTLVEVDGSPEHRAVVRQMLHCARGWLRSTGRCRAIFRGPLPAKCRGCPLYEAEWALESFAPPTHLIWTSGEDDLPADVPDHVPEEWTHGPT